MVSRTIAKTGQWEILDPRDLAELAGSELPALPATFVDIGANMGYYSLLFAHAGFRVIALEPLEHNRRAIEASMCLNPRIAPRISLLPVALGEPTGTSACVIESSSEKNRGNGVMRCGPAMACPRGARTVCEVVALRRLDDVLADPSLRVTSVDVVKMDVEGSECTAMAGGQSLFEKWRPKLVQVELKQRRVRTCALAQARKHGYTFGEKRGHDQNAVMVDARAESAERAPAGRARSRAQR